VGTSELIQQIKKIPVLLLAAVGVLYVGYDYWTFIDDASSPLNISKSQIQSEGRKLSEVQQRLAAAESYRQVREDRRIALQSRAQELFEMRDTIDHDLNIPEFIKMVVTEAEKVGLEVLSFEPAGSREEEHYLEQTFNLRFSGIYVQLVVFLNRLANVQRIIQVGNFNFTPKNDNTGRFVILEGSLELKTYRYAVSQADEVAQTSSSQGGEAR
jgi:Tfp pilus assembly protein PilO